MYYLAIVNLRDAFNNEKLKVRPCVVIKETKKHINVLTITHHFTPNRNAIPVVRNGKISYINVSAIMTCKKEYITKRLHKIDKKLEEKIKQELKVCSRKYCCSYENAHYKPDVYNESQEYLQEKVKSHDILNMYMRGKDTNGYKNSDIIENDKVYVEFVDNNGFKIRGTIKCVPRYLYHFKNGNVRKHPKFIDNFGLDINFKYYDRKKTFTLDLQKYNIDTENVQYTYKNVLDIVNKISSRKYTSAVLKDEKEFNVFRI